MVWRRRDNIPCTVVVTDCHDTSIASCFPPITNECSHAGWSIVAAMLGPMSGHDAPVVIHIKHFLESATATSQLHFGLATGIRNDSAILIRRCASACLSHPTKLFPSSAIDWSSETGARGFSQLSNQITSFLLHHFQSGNLHLSQVSLAELRAQTDLQLQYRVLGVRFTIGKVIFYHGIRGNLLATIDCTNSNTCNTRTK